MISISDKTFVNFDYNSYFENYPYELSDFQKHAIKVIVDGNHVLVTAHTGSGKTLTSFKTAQILTQLPNVHKVVFVVDRKDLDYQTTKEFNSFSKGSIDGTNNTNTLANQLAGDTKLIITTIQKLNTAITKNRYQSRVEVLADKKVVFIFRAK